MRSEYRVRDGGRRGGDPGLADGPRRVQAPGGNRQNRDPGMEWLRIHTMWDIVFFSGEVWNFFSVQGAGVVEVLSLKEVRDDEEKLT